MSKVLTVTTCVFLIAGSVTAEDALKKKDAVVPDPIGKLFDKNALQKLTPEQKAWVEAAVFIKNGETKKLAAALKSDKTLARRANINGTTLLHEAGDCNRAEAAEILIENGADLTATQNPYRETPFHVAARRDSLEVVKVFVTHGIDINILSNGPERNDSPHIPHPYASALDIAVSAGSERVVEFLLEHGAKLNVNPEKSHYTALHRSMEGIYNLPGYGNLERVVNAKANAAKGNSRVIELLLEHGADLQEVDFFGNKPFHVAVRCHSTETVEYLFDRHRAAIDVEDPGQFGYTPLQLVVSERFLRGGANPDESIDQAAVAIIKLLLKHGADKSKTGGPSNPPQTAFDVAIKYVGGKWGEPVLQLLRQ